MGQNLRKKMNKKQLIIAWVMGILIAWDFLALVGDWNDFAEALMVSIPILVIGSLSVYTLRNKKE